MRIGIVTDSTANLPEDWTKANDISVVPLYVRRENGLVPAIQVDLIKYYQAIRDNQFTPSTSQPSPDDFAKVYERMAPIYDTIISVHISEKLSGTCNSARLAAKSIGGDIRVIDSQLTAWALGFLVKELANARDQGKTIDELVSIAEQFSLRSRTLFTVHDIIYLYRGGRISRASVVMGRILSIFPILTLENGEVKLLQKTRGKNVLLDRILKSALHHEKGHSVKKVAVMHCDNLKDATSLKVRIQDQMQLKVDAFEFSLLDPVIGAHVGPGSVGITTLWE